MAEIITLQTAIVPILQAAAQKIADKYNGIRADEMNWMIHCPLHDDERPSCHIEVKDRLLAYCHVCGKEKQKELINKFKEDDLWVIIEQPKKSTETKELQSNIPAHAIPEMFPQVLFADKRNWPVVARWTYYTRDGKPAFWVLRADCETESGKPYKVAKPFSSYTENGKSFFKIGLTCNSRPLYNLPDIINYPDNPVLIVEGEKTADAAMKLIQEWNIVDDSALPYTVTTWSGGVNGHSRTDFGPLINRDVVLFPDNDEPGVKAMKEIAQLLPKARLTFQETQKDLPEKWDIADIDESSTHVARVCDLIRDAKPLERIIENVDYSLEKLRERYQRIEYDGGTGYVDIQSRTHDRPPNDPFKMWTSSNKFLDGHPAFEVTFNEGKPQRVKAVLKLIEDTVSAESCAVGYTFDPTTTEPRVMKGSCLYLNSFLGIEHSPQECDQALYQVFLDHINGFMGETDSVWFLDFLAHIFQKIEEKPRVMPILTGKPGTGKSIIGNVMMSILGMRLATCLQCGAVFDSKFNGMLANKLLVVFDELNLYGATNKHANEILKVLVTDPYMIINEKYMRSWYLQSYHRFIGTTNIDVPVHIDMSDRRYAVFKVNDQFLGNTEHFNKIVKIMRDPVALCGLAYYFKTRQITTNIFWPPHTEARQLAQRPEDPVLDMLHSWLNEGQLPEEIRARLFNSGWPEKTVRIPRTIVCDYIRKKHPSLSLTRISQGLLKHLKWDRPDGKYNNTTRIITVTSDKKGTEEIKDRVFEIKSINAQRQIYECETNTKPKWQEITFDEDTDIVDNKPVEPF